MLVLHYAILQDHVVIVEPFVPVARIQVIMHARVNLATTEQAYKEIVIVRNHIQQFIYYRCT